MILGPRRCARFGPPEVSPSRRPSEPRSNSAALVLSDLGPVRQTLCPRIGMTPARLCEYCHGGPKTGCACRFARSERLARQACGQSGSACRNRRWRARLCRTGAGPRRFPRKRRGGFADRRSHVEPRQLVAGLRASRSSSPGRSRTSVAIEGFRETEIAFLRLRRASSTRRIEIQDTRLL